VGDQLGWSTVVLLLPNVAFQRSTNCVQNSQLCGNLQSVHQRMQRHKTHSFIVCVQTKDMEGERRVVQSADDDGRTRLTTNSIQRLACS